MKPGDPSPRSPHDVLADRAYRHIDSRAIGMSVQLTVLHCGTETHWQTCYGLGLGQDRLPATWYEVRPQPVTRIEYRRVD